MNAFRIQITLGESESENNDKKKIKKEMDIRFCDDAALSTVFVSVLYMDCWDFAPFSECEIFMLVSIARAHTLSV